MRATLRSKSGLFMILGLLLGVTVAACSNQSGSNGPANPAGQTGSDDAGVFVAVTVHRAAVDVGDRAGVTVLVTNVNGRALEGRHVQLGISNASVGRLDAVDGFTDADGKFVTFLFCNADGVAEITAFALGGASPRGGPASGTAKVTCGTGGPIATTTTTTTTGTTP